MDKHPIIPLLSLAITSILFGVVYFNGFPNAPGGTLVGCVAFTIATAFAYWLRAMHGCVRYEVDTHQDASTSTQNFEIMDEYLNQNSERKKTSKSSVPTLIKKLKKWIQKVKKWMSKLGKGQDSTYEPDQNNQDDDELHQFGQNSRTTDSKSLNQKSGTMDSDMLKKQQRDWKKISHDNEQPKEKAGLSYPFQAQSNTMSEDQDVDDGCQKQVIITAIVSTISTITLVSIIAVAVFLFPEAFSQFWDVVKKNVEEGKTMINDNVEAAVDLLTETQNQDTFTFKSLYDKFMNLF